MQLKLAAPAGNGMSNWNVKSNRPVYLLLGERFVPVLLQRLLDVVWGQVAGVAGVASSSAAAAAAAEVSSVSTISSSGISACITLILSIEIAVSTLGIFSIVGGIFASVEALLRHCDGGGRGGRGRACAKEVESGGAGLLGDGGRPHGVLEMFWMEE